MSEDDGRWWDTIPKEAVDELHIRQHPYHSRKKPRFECPLCWEQYTAELNIVVNGRTKPKAPSMTMTGNESRSTYQPPLKRLANVFKYWNEEDT